EIYTLSLHDGSSDLAVCSIVPSSEGEAESMPLTRKSDLACASLKLPTEVSFEQTTCGNSAIRKVIGSFPRLVSVHVMWSGLNASISVTWSSLHDRRLGPGDAIAGSDRIPRNAGMLVAPEAPGAFEINCLP